MAFFLSILLVVAGCSSQKSPAPASVAEPTTASSGQALAPSTANPASTSAPSSASTSAQAPSPAPSSSQNASASKGPQVAAKDISAIPVLYYHSVLEEKGNELRMPPSQFREQMQYLKEHGYETISPAQLLSFFKGEGSLPKHPVLITFDDGYVDNYTNAYPILKEFGFSATVFMISGALDSSGFLSTSQIQDLAANGWTIGAHTKNHEHLPKLTAARQVDEMKGAKDALEEKLGRPVTAFAYPYGEYNSQIKKEAKDIGFTLAFTTERGWAKQGADPLLISRVYCYANMGMQEFKRRIENPNY